MRKTLFLLLLVLPNFLSAQNQNHAAQPIVIGERLTFTSKILGEEREVLIHLPAGYQQSSEKYPVMYLLDGNAHFHHTTGIIQFLSGNSQMPQMIVVALPNTDRTRDLTPAILSDTTSNLPTAGGADTFLKFIDTELRPFVEQNYRTQPYRVLVGHSFGGLFAVNALLTHPDVFDAYIAISPSLWWDNERLVTDYKKFLKSNPELNKFLFCTLGGEGDRMEIPAKNFIKVLEKNAPDGLQWEFRFMENEDHGSTPHRSIYDGLEALYSGWRLPMAVFREGRLEEFDAHFAALSEKFGYEITTPESAINRLGYRLLGEKKYDKAIAVFKTNLERYPESANVYDSLGDGYDANGQFELAKKNYEMAYMRALDTSHPNLEIYKRNYQRLQKKLVEKRD